MFIFIIFPCKIWKIYTVFVGIWTVVVSGPNLYCIKWLIFMFSSSFCILDFQILQIQMPQELQEKEKPKKNKMD